MLQTKSIRTTARLESTDLQHVLIAFARTDWKPVLLESQRRIVELAGLQDQVRLPIRDFRAYGRAIPPDLFPGDVFFKDSDIYYLLSHGGERDLIYRHRYWVTYEQTSEPGLELGIITGDATKVDEKLRSFAEAFQSKVMESLDGRKTRHMQFDWQESAKGTPQLDRISSSEAAESDVRFERPEMRRDELNAAKALAAESIRRMLVELNQAGFARARDVLSGKGKRQEELHGALEELKRHNLVNVEYLLECKRSGMPLIRLAEKDQLDNSAIGDLQCAMCNNKFKDEVLSEGYSVSEMGRRLSQKSNWMTIWVTDQLLNVGVPQDSILWNLYETGEEVDLLVEFLGELWIFELKDREFGSGDAHPLNYRQVRYRATKAIIITTEKVSRDARRVFDELARERSRRGGTPVYVEGLDAVHDAMSKEVSAASLRYAYQKLATITELSGYDFRPIIAAKFGEVAPANEGNNGELLPY